MPARAPGRTFTAIATKEATHNHPAVELNHAGVAAKSTQPAPAVPSVANALAATKIAIGEEFVIMLDGKHDILSSLLPEGAVAGSRVWINPADNKLLLTDEAGEVHPAVKVTITATGGTFTMTVDGEVTAAVAFNATAAVLREALAALPNIQAGDITVTGGPGATAAFIVTFVDGPYADGPAPAIAASGAELTGGAKTAVVAAQVVGVKGSEAVKFGLVDEIDTATGLATINCSERSSF